MRRALITSVVILMGAGRMVGAAEDGLDAVRGLRERQMFDAALAALDRLESDPNLPADTKTRILFERAVTLEEGASAVTSPSERSQQLDRALDLFAKFAENSPEHTLAGQAHSRRGDVLLGRARAELVRSRDPAEGLNRRVSKEMARSVVVKARAAYQSAYDQAHAAFATYAVFIDPVRDPRQYEERRLTEKCFIKTRLDLATCRYEEAQTFDPQSGESLELLLDAAQQFERIHGAYRSQLGGLTARLWQGRCFEEMGQYKKALGIFNELLGHPSKVEAMRTMQDQALQFRLECLNSDQKKDYLLVVQEADEWLQKNPMRRDTAVGLAIRWECLRANEALWTMIELPKEERDAGLHDALSAAKEFNAAPGPYQEPASRALIRIEAILKRERATP